MTTNANHFFSGPVPNCCFCNLPLSTSNDWSSDETGEFSWNAWHAECLSPTAEGRYLAPDKLRYSSVGRAASIAEHYAAHNHRMSFFVIDTETNEVVSRHSMQKEERRRWFWYCENDRELVLACGMPKPVIPIGGTKF